MVQDVAELASHVLTSKGKHGFSDRHRGQLMTMTGELSLLGPSKLLSNRM
jgi:hypothetical protein